MSVKRPTYWKVIGDLVLLASVLGVVSFISLRPVKRQETPRPTLTVPTVTHPPAPRPTPRVSASTSRAPELDRVAVGKAEAELDAAARDRARADARAADAALRLENAQTDAASVALRVKTLAERVRDPRARVDAAQARGELLQVEIQMLVDEMKGLAATPRPKRTSIVDRSPVAKPTRGGEYHFELHNGRAAYIDLDRLIELTKADARMQLRNGLAGRTIRSRVGPVGAFSLAYELGRSGIGLDGSGGARADYDLVGWQIIPRNELRGESLEQALRPTSEFRRAVSRLSPSSATITIWVYPDSFALYRKLRDVLHDAGFLVAARPLPTGMPIRGSPSGSISAGQ